MITGSCHCGAVAITVPEPPVQVTSCNCSICRRLGWLIAYYDPAVVEVDAAPDATAGYVWGDRTLAIHHCRTCGCATHWTSTEADAGPRMGVNARLFDPEVILSVAVRHLDGADTWKVLDG